MIAALLPALLPIFQKVIEKVVPDTAKQTEMLAEMQRALLDNEKSLVEAASKVMVADAASGSYVRNARPTVVYWSLAMVSVIALIAPFGYAGAMVGALQAVPGELYNLMAVGIGAFSLTRGLQHTAREWKR